jgi:tight adherence protein C
MEQLFHLLGTLLDDPQVLGYVFIGLIGLAAAAVGLAAMFLVGSLSDPMRQRLRALTGEPRKSSAAQSLAAAVQPISGLVLPDKEVERSRISAKLIQSGFRSPGALTTFYATKSLLALLLPVLTLSVFAWIPDTTAFNLVMYAVIASAIGVAAPNFLLNRAWEGRRKRLRNSLPDALDLLVVCTEAGLGLKQALQRVADEIAPGHPELAGELALVNAEMRVGIERAAALRGLAERTGLEDVRSLVTLISQSMQFGTSVADALRIYAEEFRDKRTQAAEEQAAKIGAKMMFPLVLCLFPAFFVVVVGPAVLGVLSALSGM